MIESSNNKRIAKNTLLLYFRMFVVMGVSLYTARVVLDKLGADDFGLYNVVGGVVAMLGFLNNTLSTSTSRFITYAIGQDDKNNLSKIFCTSFYSHLLLAIIVIAILEIGGTWFIMHKLIIPEDRMFAALVVFQFSLVTCLVSMTQVPYLSEIIAHERMGIYAYLGLFEAFSKLLIVYLLTIMNTDKLILYGLLIMIVQIIIAFVYRFPS